MSFKAEFKCAVCGKKRSYVPKSISTVRVVCMVCRRNLPLASQAAILEAGKFRKVEPLSIRRHANCEICGGQHGEEHNCQNHNGGDDRPCTPECEGCKDTRPAEWSGSQCTVDPDGCWIDDETEEHVNAKTAERTANHPAPADDEDTDNPWLSVAEHEAKSMAAVRARTL